MSNDTSPDEIDRNTLFQILSNERRRIIIYILREEGTIDITELTDRVASIHSNEPIDKLNQNTINATYVSLRQTHLRKLEEYNLVEYDKERGIVKATDRLLNLSLDVVVSKNPSSRILDFVKGVVGVIAIVIVISVWSPELVGITIGAGALTLIMTLLSITLGLIYYFERASGPNIDEILIEGE